MTRRLSLAAAVLAAAVVSVSLLAVLVLAGAGDINDDDGEA